MNKKFNTILLALQTIQTERLDTGFKVTCGICYNVFTVLEKVISYSEAHDLYQYFTKWVEDNSPRWEKYSGHNGYPVPNPYENLFQDDYPVSPAARAYNKVANKWEGEYGDLLESRETGILPKGKFRTLADLCVFARPKHLEFAKTLIMDEALNFVNGSL